VEDRSTAADVTDASVNATGNRAWAVHAAIAVAAAGVLLHAGLLLLHFAARSGAGATPRIVPGRALSPGGVGGRRLPSGAVWLRTVPAGRRASATVGGLAIPAAVYDHAEVAVRGGHPEMLALLLWTTAEAPGRVQSVPLFWTDGGERLAVRLRGLDTWTGTVTGVGVDFPGPSSGPLVVEQVRLSPASPASDLGFAWQEWLAREGVRAYSANFVLAGPPWAPRRLPVVPATAAWIGLALALYAVWRTARGEAIDRRVVAAVLAIGWLALDLRWQYDLFRQLELTLGGPETRLPAPDADLQQLAAQVGQQLEGEPRILFVLTRDHRDAGRYTQLRMAYLLRPHNVSVDHSFPPEGRVRPGTYLLVMGARTDLWYDSARGELRWNTNGGAPSSGGGSRVLVEPILRTEGGALYRAR